MHDTFPNERKWKVWHRIIYALPVFLCNVLILTGGIDIYNVMTWRREVKRLFSTEVSMDLKLLLGGGGVGVALLSPSCSMPVYARL